MTLAAAGGELAGVGRSGSLFLLADVAHLFAHVGIFAVLAMPAARRPGPRERATTVVVLAIVLAIAAGIIVTSARALASERAGPHAAVLLLSLLGLGANTLTAWLFRAPAASLASFRAALVHELADAMITVAGLLGAGAIACFGWWWVDPGLGLAVGGWLTVWALRLLGRGQPAPRGGGDPRR